MADHNESVDQNYENVLHHSKGIMMRDDSCVIFLIWAHLMKGNVLNLR